MMLYFDMALDFSSIGSIQRLIKTCNMYAFLTVLCYHSELAQRVLSILKQTMFP